ncbi:MAG: NAD(+)--dinitrogen-reductase ADP-D-ribosyltransferase [Alphaproteobacteria bacterium]|nr:NAD(+)--dinitrogen-reductase ADP-D-ribosyltransferase [Alphaproteobacteria bacterium]
MTTGRLNTDATTLPRQARLALNRCNVPPVILGGLTFQRYPQPLELDGVASFHADLFADLDGLSDPQARAEKFQDYMAVQFRLYAPEDAGGEKREARVKADYLRTLRGWFFDTDGREGAVVKSWAESRFGLTVRHHKKPLPDPADPAYALFLKDRANGLYSTNALEAQLDLVQAYCQYELARRIPGETHMTLYRGVNRLDDFEVLQRLDKRNAVILLNNVNSFTTDRDTAGEFGDHILTARVPLAKIFFFSGLLPGRMSGENEYIVLGGVYEVAIATF